METMTENTTIAEIERALQAGHDWFSSMSDAEGDAIVAANVFEGDLQIPGKNLSDAERIAILKKILDEAIVKKSGFPDLAGSLENLKEEWLFVQRMLAEWSGDPRDYSPPQNLMMFSKLYIFIENDGFRELCVEIARMRGAN